jgi:Planctomycete cytochrome C
MQLQEKIRLAASILAALVLMTCVVHAQETEPAVEPAANVSPVTESGKLIQFERDIAPVLRSRCLRCHGPNDAKNDFRVDDSEIFLGYIEAGDHESSSLFVEYLTTDDAELLMPPKSHGGPLSASELALLRVWIDEGAEWPAGATVVQTESVEPAPASKPEAPKTLMGRVWAALGFLHPATVHFPIALFMLGAGFVVLGWKWPNVGFQIPLACLLLGTATAIASTTMGWSFAPERGHEGWNLLDWD